MSLFSAIAVAVLLFVTTNIDDIFVLVTFFADPAFGARHIVVGQFIGMAALIGLSLAGSLLALVAPGEYVGLLGVVPFVLGVTKTAKMLRRSKHDEEERAPTGKHGVVISVALVTIANGGDNIGAYVPVFATRTSFELVVTASVFFAMTALWCVVGRALVSHPRVGPTVRRIAVPVTPFVLMTIGALIVIGSGAYRLLVR